MHFKMSSAISFNLDQSKIFSSGNGLSFMKIPPRGPELSLYFTSTKCYMLKLKVFASDKLPVAEFGRETVEIIVGKRENAD